jgi:hypothetical protein
MEGTWMGIFELLYGLSATRMLATDLRRMDVEDVLNSVVGGILPTMPCTLTPLPAQLSEDCR